MTTATPPGLRAQTWPTVDGDLHFVDVGDADPVAGATAVLDRIGPGDAVLVEDAALRDALVQRGATLVRHVHGMRHGLEPVPDGPPSTGLQLRRWQVGDARALAPALVAAYGAGHPDQRSPDVEAASAYLAAMVDDPDNPLLPHATAVAVAGERPIGAVVVLRCEHVEGWHGPWVMNIFRAPDPSLSGVGAALLVAAVRALAAAGEASLGLAVTHANPARRVYERLGFRYRLEGWVLVLPHE